MPAIYYCPAKINLYLEVLGKRDDGFHDIVSIMQTVSWFDRLSIEIIDGPDELKVVGPAAAGAPADGSNLVFRAADVFRERTGVTRGVGIFLEKSIPAGAGLGGGSSNAAATLSALNRLCGTELPHEDLSALAAQVGSDVPFFLTGGCALAEGRGEIITKLSQISFGDYFVLLVPPLVISTASVYKKLKRNLTPAEESPKLNKLPGADLRGISSAPAASKQVVFGRNDLLEAAFQACPNLAATWRSFEKLFAGVRGMSGSGSCLYAVCNTREEATIGAKALQDAAMGYVTVVEKTGAPFLHS